MTTPTEPGRCRRPRGHELQCEAAGFYGSDDWNCDQCSGDGYTDATHMCLGCAGSGSKAQCRGPFAPDESPAAATSVVASGRGWKQVRDNRMAEHHAAMRDESPAAEPPDVDDVFDEAFGVWYDAACSEDYGRTSRLITEAESATRKARVALAALREQLATMERRGDDHLQAWRKAEADLATMERERDFHKWAADDVVRTSVAALAEAEAENTRLRAALTAIVEDIRAQSTEAGCGNDYLMASVLGCWATRIDAALAK